MLSNTSIISKHGQKYIVYALLAFVLFLFLDLEFFAYGALFLAAFFAYTFRNPEIEVETLDDTAVLSVANGTITDIKKLEEEEEFAYKIEIDTSYLECGVLRCPFEATLEDVVLTRGARVSKKSKQFQDLNEYAALIFTAQSGTKVLVGHQLKQSYAPLFIDVQKESELIQTARYGMALNSVTSIYLPKNVTIKVTLEQEVKAGKTILATLS